MSEVIRKVAHCPHCGNRATQNLIHKQVYRERIWSAVDGAEADTVPWSMFVAVCETCEQVLLYENIGDAQESERFNLCELAYPEPASFDVSVPDRVRVAYAEASHIRKASPNGFAVLIRGALEALCKDKGIQRGSLQAKLKALADQGHVPPLFADAADLLRELGNVAAHEQTVHPLLVPAIDEFFRAVVEYVYVAPKRVSEFRRRMDKYRNRQ